MATTKTTVVAKKPAAKTATPASKAAETKKATVTKATTAKAGTTKVAPAKTTTTTTTKATPAKTTATKATTAKAGTTKVAPAKTTTAKATTTEKKPVAKAPKAASASKVVMPKAEEKKSGATVYHVSKRGESKADREWKVFIQGSSKVIKLFDTQKEALDYALELADNKDDGSYVLLHGLDGKMRKY